MNRPLLPALAAALALAGCTNPAGVAGVREATQAEVASCAYVSNIRMTPGLYGPVVGDQALKYARNTVMADARNAGANTVVFAQATPGTEVYMVEAVAYRC